MISPSNKTALLCVSGIIVTVEYKILTRWRRRFRMVWSFLSELSSVYARNCMSKRKTQYRSEQMKIEWVDQKRSKRVTEAAVHTLCCHLLRLAFVGEYYPRLFNFFVALLVSCFVFTFVSCCITVTSFFVLGVLWSSAKKDEQEHENVSTEERDSDLAQGLTASTAGRRASSDEKWDWRWIGKSKLDRTGSKHTSQSWLSPVEYGSASANFSILRKM